VTALAQPASPLSIGSLAQLTLSLLAIVVLIFAFSWLLKRFKVALPRGSADMAVLDQVAIGPRERIALVRVGDQQVLVGIGAGGIVPLTPLAAPISLRTGTSNAPFAERLRDMMKRPGGAA
jgi:flagellar protein FliO/FliZ